MHVWVCSLHFTYLVPRHAFKPLEVRNQDIYEALLKCQLNGCIRKVMPGSALGPRVSKVNHTHYARDIHTVSETVSGRKSQTSRRAEGGERRQAQFPTNSVNKCFHFHSFPSPSHGSPSSVTNDVCLFLFLFSPLKSPVLCPSLRILRSLWNKCRNLI